MVNMFMSDQNPAKLLSLNIQSFQTFLYSFFADSCIYKKMCMLSSRIDTIATASAGNTA